MSGSSPPLDAFFHQAPIGFFVTDHEGLILEINDTLSRWLETPRENICHQKAWPHLLSIGGRLYFENYLKQQLKHSGELNEISLDMKKANGDKFPILISAHRIKHGREQKFYYFTVTDISQRRAFEKELILAKKEAEQLVRELKIKNMDLEQFAHTVSHDLQEPNRMVISFLNQLKKKYSDLLDAKGLQYLHFAVEGAQRMQTLTRELLSFSKTGSVPLDTQSTDVNSLIEETLQDHRKLIKAAQAKITYQPLPVIQASPILLGQVFSNLIQNAIKYKRPNVPPVIHITHLNKDKYWEFIVTDNGIGIKKQDYERIFVLFHRLHRKDEYTGNGIGLATCKKIIERHGGEIWVEAAAHQGSAFHFTISKTSAVKHY